MRLPFTLLLLCWTAGSLFSQVTDGRPAKVSQPLSAVEAIALPVVDNAKLRAEERKQQRPGRAPHFALTRSVDINPEENGTWTTSAEGLAVWRLRIHSPKALSLNLGFGEYYMPPGGAFYIYTPDRQEVQGPFTPADNEVHDQLWTPILPGDEAVLEVQLPAERRAELRLRLTSINHDFLGFNSIVSGSCNLDVNCGDADGWGIIERYRDIIQSVAVIGLGGNRFCSGFLINNARQDCTPFFMTANHCEFTSQNAASMVAYWNYANSSCRQPGSPSSGGAGDGKLNTFNTGAFFRAGSSASDFTLLELDDPLPAEARAFLAGWNISRDVPADTVISIHHPGGDEKRISFRYGGTVIQGSNTNTANFLRIPFWDVGTTEGGSSGAPLFNAKSQIIGQLYGGLAACGNRDYDSYGWLAASWEGGGTKGTRLRDWLDPDGLGLTELPGNWYQACARLLSTDQPVRQLCLPDSAVYELTVSEGFSGTVSLSVDSLPAGVTAIFTDNDLTPGGTTTLVIKPTTGAVSGDYILAVRAQDDMAGAVTYLRLQLSAGDVPMVDVQTPGEDATQLPRYVFLGWKPLSSIFTYEWQVAADSAFTQLLREGAGLTTNEVIVDSLESGRTYYWRVRATDNCSVGAWSAVKSFGTAPVLCEHLSAGGLPIVIPSQGTPTIHSSISVNVPGPVNEIRIHDLRIDHDWVGDLDVSLRSPEGKTIQLFDQPGFPDSDYGCNGADVTVTLTDAAEQTAETLENTCNNEPAIAGAFRPLESLTGFNGQQARGQWRLSIKDNNNFDGGSLQAWSLEVCAALPTEAVIVPLADELKVCSQDTAQLSLIIGSGFDGDNVQISLLHPELAAWVTEPSGISPGSVVDLALHQFSAAGNFDLTLIADDGSQRDTITLPLQVLTIPTVPSPRLPANDTVDVTVQYPVLAWNGREAGDNYEVVLAEDADFQSVVFEQRLTSSAMQTEVSRVLHYATNYYWRVRALNDCGFSDWSPTQRFTTIPDLNIHPDEAEIAACVGDTVSYVFQLGPGFGPAPEVRMVSTPSLMHQLESSFDTTRRRLTTLISGLPEEAAREYILTFHISGEGYERQTVTTLLLNMMPEPAPLRTPADHAQLTSDTVAFSWSSVPGGEDYRLTVAADVLFEQVIHTVVLPDTSYRYVLPDMSAYYWRVTTINACGEAVSPPATFTFKVVDTQEPALVGVRVYPNPASEQLWLELPADWPMTTRLQMWDALGQPVRQWTLSAGEGRYPLDISGLAPGFYLLRLQTDEGKWTQAIIVSE